MTTCPRCGKETEMPFHTCKTMTTKTARVIAQGLISGSGELEESEAAIEALVDLARVVREIKDAVKAGYPRLLDDLFEVRDKALARVEKLVEI